MSVAPEAFEWLRRQAYAHARTCGDERRQYDQLRGWCIARLTDWLSRHPEGSEMPDAQLHVTAAGVARYVSQNYRPHRRRSTPRKTGDHRAAEELLITTAMEEARKPTVRHAAGMLDISKSKASRLLIRQGVAPIRTAKAAALRPTSRRLLDLLGRVHGREGDRLFDLDDLASHLWQRTADEATRRQHRKRIKDALRDIGDGGLGFHVEASSTHAVVRLGRCWKPGEAAAMLASAASVSLVPLSRLLAMPSPGGAFWSAPEIKGIVAALRLASGERLAFDELHPYIRAHSRIQMLDTTPLATLFWRALEPCHSDDMAVEKMHTAGYRLRSEEDPVRQKLGRDIVVLANSFQLCREDGRWGRCAHDCLTGVLENTDVKRAVDGPGRQRIDHLLQLFDRLWHEDPCADVLEGLALCRRLADQESAGLWEAPDYSDCPF